MTNPLAAYTTEDLYGQLDALHAEREATQQKALAIQAELDNRATRAKLKALNLSDEMIDKLMIAPQGIQSGEAVGTPGSP